MVFNGLDGSFAPKPIYRKDIPRKKKVNWDQVTNNEGIPILSFAMNGISPLQKVKFQRLEHDGAYVPNPAELLWICSKLKAEKVPNWGGFMSTFSKSTSTMPSSIVMLPIIDLNANDPTALYSLLKFIYRQCERLNYPETAVTFDQPLYIKSYEIVKHEKLPIFVRLCLPPGHEFPWFHRIPYGWQWIERCFGSSVCN